VIKLGQYRRKVKKGVRWLFKGQYLNQRYHSRAIYLSKKEAKDAERKKIEELDRSARSGDNDLALISLFDKRLDYIQTNQSKKYYEENRRFYQKFLDFAKKIKKKMVSEFKKADAREFLTDFSRELKTEGKDNFKVNACIRILKAAFNEAIDDYEIDMKNPFKIKFFPIEINTKDIPLDEDVLYVRERLTEEEKLLFDFVDQSACRIMEAIRLKSEDIRGDKVTLYTRKSKNQNFTPRIIPLPDCLKGVNGSGKLFGWNSYPHFLGEKTKALEKAQLIKKRFNWHSLRHRRASIWANNGMTLIELQYRLGHSNLETTQKYLQLLGFTKL
jgi:integrase/recombinase XerD